jgi:hypothetical protein
MLMFAVKAQITKCIDDEGYPSIVECRFSDAYGETQIFHEKDAIVTTEMLDRNSRFPQDGTIGCEILGRKNVNGREVVKVDTGLPWHIESVDGETLFEVLPEQIIEFEHNQISTEHLFIPFKNGLATREFYLQNLYEAFNRREIETVLSMMAEDVKWANGMEGGFVYGRENVRDYWRRQFEIINPQLEILKTEIDESNRAVVTVHQIVRDLSGKLLAEKTVRQIFTIENGLIKIFEIGE